MKLDAYDVRILATLQQEGRITKLKLAERIGLSPSPCWERMRRLEQAGVIRGFHADIDAAKVVRVTTVFVEVTLSSHRGEDFARFEAAVNAREEILECWSISGGSDYLLKVVTTDIERYQALIDDLLAAEIAISRYFTYIVTKRVKQAPGAPLATLQRLAHDETAG
ncbi:Lrp/AsnC family transcriptional regulator [Rhodovibrio salinarum]|uniref:Lrp/AsnC family transcriptional regulator n=1 Tax=Rhodovibrio salinarum TaxID=1087 RepID=A0A934QMA8_9PROT|nr:Lrp/AsnC family transcriptional regulator [Rhodovibrio salinarum]MBK1699065.1 Lrp/AsnC family transcriptional regulator [Rhodovibrio salinarum]